MKKIICLALCGALAVGALGLSACSKELPRNCYSMTLEYSSETRTLTGDMTAQIVNTTENACETLSFQLWANAYREGAKYAPVSELFTAAAYYQGASYGGIEVTGVTGAQGFRVAGEDANILEVTLTEPLYPGEQVTLGMQFCVTLAQVNHRLGVGENAVTLTGFYPVLCSCGGTQEHVYADLGDPFVSECADYEVTLTLPESYTLAYTGEGERTVSDGKATYHVRAENVRDVAMVCSEKFKTVETQADGVPVTYYYLDDSSPERTLAVAAESLSYYSECFTDYAYGQYAVVETDFPYGGMEYPMLSMIANDLRAEEVPLVVAHETAHQWWYAMVGSDQFCESWQDEGLAEFSAALFLDDHPDYGRTYEQCVADSEEAYRVFFSVWSQISDGEQTSMRRPLTEFAGEYEYRNVVYDKGLILFDRLYDLLGKEKTLSALREYAREYTGKIAPPEALVACFASRGNYAEGVFDSFLEGTCVI